MQTSASIFMHCAAKEEEKDNICMTEVVILYLILVYMIKELIFANKKIIHKPGKICFDKSVFCKKYSA